MVGGRRGARGGGGVAHNEGAARVREHVAARPRGNYVDAREKEKCCASLYLLHELSSRMLLIPCVTDHGARHS